jgi:signal transduction histidine kinase
MEAAVAVEDYVGACKKALNSSTERRSHAHLDDRAAKAVQATNQIGSALNQFRQLYKGGSELAGAKAPFDLQEAVKYVETTLAGALARRKVAVKTQYTGSMRISGFREIFIQILFNLFINSLDAIPGTRPSNIFIHAHEEKQTNPRRLVVQFWDTGPGINLRFFSKPEEIFEVGKTSKPTGTGTGLPVARRLLGQYFNGDIVLVKPEEARFRITIPEGD